MAEWTINEPINAPECGEGCGRLSIVEVEGLTFCPDCLALLVRLGRIFADAAEEASGPLADLAAAGKERR